MEDVIGHSFLSTKIGSVIDLAQNPTYVILDLGCTKPVGSRYTVNRFIKATHVHGLDYELIPWTSIVSFATPQTTTVHQALTIAFPTKPPMCTIVDIVEQGRVQILFSLQIKNLQMQLDTRTDLVLITCEARGLHHVQATQSSSSHIVIDLAAILHVPSRTLCNCESDFLCFFAGDSEMALGTCPACAADIDRTLMQKDARTQRPHTVAAAVPP